MREKAATSPAGRAAASPCADEVLQGLRHDDNFRVHRLPSIVERPELAPCPNADRCADAHRCSGVIYKAYVDLYGIAELEPSGRRPTQAKD